MTERVKSELAVRLLVLLLVSVIASLTVGLQEALSAESVDQYLDRMRMRRDSVAYQVCLDRAMQEKSYANSAYQMSACVPPDYNTQQEAWVSGEWDGTVEDEVVEAVKPVPSVLVKA